uniref:Transposase n=1 Tax=Candidatus Nitrotoga fabula TaxID=2182327 RepID=A0A2X0QUY6_9PROT|nr:transposase [Candidatus Nitrotoga fabula]
MLSPQHLTKGKDMSRFARASHVIWHCQYHLVWVPKYRFRILQGPVGREVYKCVMIFSQQLGCEVVELNVQADHVHLLVKVPPKLSVSGLMGILKGRTAIRLFSVFPFLKKRPYWSNHFWAKGYCVDTVGLNGEMIQKYVRFQEKEEQHQEQLQLEPGRAPSWKAR